MEFGYILTLLVMIQDLHENEITGLVIQNAIEIHKEMGPGLFESIYEEILFRELLVEELEVKRQVEVPVIWNGKDLGIGFRADLIINDKVIIELKSVQCLAPVHHKQLLTYLKLTGISVGLLINFNQVLLTKGIKRIVNNFEFI